MAQNLYYKINGQKKKFHAPPVKPKASDIQEAAESVFDSHKSELVGTEYLTDLLDIEVHSASINVFNKADVIDGKTPANTVNTSRITDLIDYNGKMSNQTFSIKQGDVIRTNKQYSRAYFYNASGVLVKYMSTWDSTLTYIVESGITQMKVSAISATIDALMITINNDMPTTYTEYTSATVTTTKIDDVESKIQTDGKIKLDKGFVIISFDAFNFEDNRFAIVNNEYGFKASGSIAKTECDENASTVKTKYKQMIANGWDIHLYSKENYPPDTYGDACLVANPSAEIQSAWDTYVSNTISSVGNANVFNAVCWGARSGVCCDGLINALKKNGMKMVRCGGSTYGATYSEDYRFAVGSPASLIPSKLNDCLSAIDNARNTKRGISFVTHKLYATTSEAEAGYGLTETDLRTFLNRIKQYVDDGTLEVITFHDIYSRYFPSDSYKYDFDRTNKILSKLMS